MSLVITKTWAMPNSNTFSIKPIKQIIERYISIKAMEKHSADLCIVDPFANSNTFGTIRNDIDPQYDTQYHMDATDFLKQLETESADIILYDPPYSTRQLSECYTRMTRYTTCL